MWLSRLRSTNLIWNRIEWKQKQKELQEVNGPSLKLFFRSFSFELKRESKGSLWKTNESRLMKMSHANNQMKYTLISLFVFPFVLGSIEYHSNVYFGFFVQSTHTHIKTEIHAHAEGEKRSKTTPSSSSSWSTTAKNNGSTGLKNNRGGKEKNCQMKISDLKRSRWDVEQKKKKKEN